MEPVKCCEPKDSDIDSSCTASGLCAEDSEFDPASAAKLISRLQQLQSEREAWQKHAEQMATRLAEERWLRAGMAGGGDEDWGNSEEARALQSRADDSTEAVRSNTEEDFKWPGKCAGRLAILKTRGAASGWLISPHEIELGQTLGAGAFGETRRATWRGADVAVKQVRISSDVEMAIFLREVECLSSLRHPGVVPFLGAVVQDQTCCWVVTEFMPNGTLNTYLHGENEPRRKLSERLERALEVATALAAMEIGPTPVLHRDVKPSNVLLDGAGRARLADFGLARRKPDGDVEGVLTGETGSYFFMAPEVMRHQSYKSSADVWSFGVMLNEVITCKTPYADTFMTPVQVALAVSDSKLRPTLPDNTHPALKALCDKCCSFDPKDRPAFGQVVKELRDVLTDIKKKEAGVKKRSTSFLERLKGVKE